MLKSAVQKRSIILHNHKTSISLEEDFWSELKLIALKRKLTLSGLVGEIDQAREHSNLSSAIRVFVLHQFARAPLPVVAVL